MIPEDRLKKRRRGFQQSVRHSLSGRGASGMPEMRISPRERLVLTAIVELYIATGEAVASQGVARFFENREGLSSATLRNVMAQLGEAGFLEQLHSSAGRVPTAAAFRFYVEQIMQSGRL